MKGGKGGFETGRSRREWQGEGEGEGEGEG